MLNLTTLAYKGSVKISIKIKDKIFNVESHNNGLPTLFQSFCKFITGNKTTIEDIPEYLDLRGGINGAFVSRLVSKVHLSGKGYVFEDNTYVAKFTAVISYNQLTKAITRFDTDEYRLYLCSGSLGINSNNEVTGNNDIAYLDVTAETLSYLSPGTQAIIEWSMKLTNYGQ